MLYSNCKYFNILYKHNAISYPGSICGNCENQNICYANQQDQNFIGAIVFDGFRDYDPTLSRTEKLSTKNNKEE